MKFIICKFGKMDDGQITVTLQENDSIIVIKKVPAMVWENCGEFTLTESVKKNNGGPCPKDSLREKSFYRACAEDILAVQSRLMNIWERAVANNTGIEVLQYAA